MSSSKIIRYLPVLITFLTLASLAASFFIFPEVRVEVNKGYELLREGRTEALAEWFRSFGLWGPLLIILFMVIQMFMVVFPSWLPMIVAVLGYGAVGGVLISIVAVTVASTIGYLMGFFISKRALHRLIGQKKEEKMETLVRRYGIGVVILFRLSPILSNDAISFVAGILNMGYWRYLAATLAGITPLACAIAYFGQDLDMLREGLYWLGGAGILLYGLYIWLDIRSRREKTN